MPDIQTLVPRKLYTQKLLRELSTVMAQVIGGHPNVPIDSKKIWPYFQRTDGSDHLTITWHVHDFPHVVPDPKRPGKTKKVKKRTKPWVRNRSKALATAAGKVLKKHGAPRGTCVSVDGYLLPHQDCGFTEIK